VPGYRSIRNSAYETADKSSSYVDDLPGEAVRGSISRIGPAVSSPTEMKTPIKSLDALLAVAA
jgi:hypothetical protein